MVEPVLRGARRADNRGRPWRDTRAVLNGVLWVLGTAAQKRSSVSCPRSILRSRPATTAFSSGYEAENWNSAPAAEGRLYGRARAQPVHCKPDATDQRDGAHRIVLAPAESSELRATSTIPLPVLVPDNMNGPKGSRDSTGTDHALVVPQHPPCWRGCCASRSLCA